MLIAGGNTKGNQLQKLLAFPMLGKHPPCAFHYTLPPPRPKIFLKEQSELATTQLKTDVVVSHYPRGAKLSCLLSKAGEIQIAASGPGSRIDENHSLDLVQNCFTSIDFPTSKQVVQKLTTKEGH